MTLVKLALKNLERKRVRTIAIILVATLASGLIFGATTILKSVQNSLEIGMARLGADIMVVPVDHEEKGRKILLAGAPTSFYMNSGNFEKVLKVPGVQKASPQLFATSSVLLCCSMPTVLLVGYDPKTDFTITPWTQRRHTVSKEQLDEVTIGIQTLYSTEGAIMRFYGKKFKISGSLEETGIGFLDYSIFMTIDAARDMIARSATDAEKPLYIGSDQISSVLVIAGREFDVHRVAADIEKSVPGIKALITKDVIAAVRKDTEFAVWGVLTVGASFWVMMLIMMGLVFAMTVNERERELGILRAMGASKVKVVQLILMEAMILTGAGAAAGIGLALAVIISFKKLIIAALGNIPFMWPSSLYIGSIGMACLLLMLLSGIAAALYPAIKNSRTEPYDAIHQGM